MTTKNRTVFPQEIAIPETRPYLNGQELHRFTDVEQQDFVNAINSMMRAALEKDEAVYDACYERVQMMLDEHHAECSKVGGFQE